MNFYERMAKLINDDVETGSVWKDRSHTRNPRTMREPTEADKARQAAEDERLRQHHFGDKSDDKPDDKPDEKPDDKPSLTASKKSKLKKKAKKVKKVAEVLSDKALADIEKEVGVTAAQSAAAKEKVKKERAAEKALNASKKSKLKKKAKKVKKVTEVGRAETDAEAGAYSGGAKRPASRGGRATDGGNQTSQEQENRRKEQQADIERSTGVKPSLTGSKKSKLKKSKLNKESFYERIEDLLKLNELGPLVGLAARGAAAGYGAKKGVDAASDDNDEGKVNASKKSKKNKKSKKKVDDDAVSTTLRQQRTSATVTAADDEEEAETGQAVEAKKGDKDWIQKAVNPKHKGYCTPMTKATCTPARKALAKRFKKAARKEKKSGGTGWQGKV